MESDCESIDPDEKLYYKQLKGSYNRGVPLLTES